MDAKEIGARIVEARVIKGITSSGALARRLQQRKSSGPPQPVSRETVRKWEVGDTIPPPEKIEQLAQLLGVAEEWLLFGIRREDQLRHERRFMEWVSDEEMAILTNFRLTNATGQDEVRHTAARMAKKFPRPTAEIRQIRGKGNGAGKQQP